MLRKRSRLPIGSFPLRAKTTLRGLGLSLKIVNSDLPFGRFGVIVPKAVVATATGRNRLKRAAFSAFSDYQKKFAGQDVLCVLSKGAPESRDGIIKELRVLFSQHHSL